MTNTRINDLSVENSELKETIQRLGRETSQAIHEAKQAVAGVQSNRSELIELARNISHSATSMTSIEATSNGGGTNTTETLTFFGSGLTYKIQAGDTFGKIASQKGVSLDALLEANPNTDPRRLSIGKEINIPAN